MVSHNHPWLFLKPLPWPVLRLQAHPQGETENLQRHLDQPGQRPGSGKEEGGEAEGNGEKEGENKEKHTENVSQKDYHLSPLELKSHACDIVSATPLHGALDEDIDGIFEGVLFEGTADLVGREEVVESIGREEEDVALLKVDLFHLLGHDGRFHPHRLGQNVLTGIVLRLLTAQEVLPQQDVHKAVVHSQLKYPPLPDQVDPAVADMNDRGLLVDDDYHREGCPHPTPLLPLQGDLFKLTMGV